jgi:hypothetical protein
MDHPMAGGAAIARASAVDHFLQRADRVSLQGLDQSGRGHLQATANNRFVHRTLACGSLKRYIHSEVKKFGRRSLARRRFPETCKLILSLNSWMLSEDVRRVKRFCGR